MKVSVIIPARRWDHHLEKTLVSVGTLRVPADTTVETIVALGEMPSANVLPSDVLVIHNPSGTIPDGLNAAISASTGNVIVRVDSRCRVQSDHIERVLTALGDSEVGSVGGAALVLDRGLFGSTYAIAFNSMMLGPTVYRYRRSSGSVDTAYLGAWRRNDLEEVGGFDSRMVRNQDNELSDRIRASGKRVFYDAGIVVGYFNSRSFSEAVQHHHEFGLWRMVQRSNGQRALTPRHLVALMALGVLGGASVAALKSSRTRRIAFAAGVSGYIGSAGLAWTSARRLRDARPDLPDAAFHPAAPILAPALAMVLDGAWLFGILRGLLSSDRGRLGSV